MDEGLNVPHVGISEAQVNINWESVFDVIPDVISILDREYRLRRINKTMADRLGVTPGNAIGRACYEIVHNAAAPPSFCPFSKMLEDGREHSVEIFEPNLRGHFIVSVSPLYDDAGQVIGAVHVARDITLRKEAEQALLEANRGLEQRVAERTAELAKKTKSLEEVNMTLRVLLEYRERDRKETQESIIDNIKIKVLPYLNRMRKFGLTKELNDYISMIENDLKDIVSPFIRGLADKSLGISPAQIRVAEMVRSGMTNKEIANCLHISEGTVRSHRQVLRKKLGLTNNKANLRAYLQSIQ
ncbi:MAG TPA: PAS domain-containing protein [Syntrophobacteraceae bacterium]|nr:PAS domain-containing protein [Syntrophobacteraceae bacterium]